MNARSSVDRARARLADARDQLEQLRRDLALLGPVAPKSLWQASLLACGVLASAALMLYALRPAPSLPGERLARRDTMRVVHARETERVRGTARPEPPTAIPAGAYAKLEALRHIAGPNGEPTLAWTQIGFAACTVQEAELARKACRKLEFAAGLGQSLSDDGTVLPELSLAISLLDAHCRARGISVKQGSPP